jgi:hypothetical protein
VLRTELYDITPCKNLVMFVVWFDSQYVYDVLAVVPAVCQTTVALVVRTESYAVIHYKIPVMFLIRYRRCIAVMLLLQCERPRWSWWCARNCIISHLARNLSCLWRTKLYDVTPCKNLAMFKIKTFDSQYVYDVLAVVHAVCQTTVALVVRRLCMLSYTSTSLSCV